MSKRLSDNELLTILKNEYNKKGELLRSRDFKSSNGLPHYQVYYNRFGSWTNAKKLVGIPCPKKKRKNMTKEILVDEFKNFVNNNNNNVPTIKELEINKFPNHYIWRYFGNYDNFITFCGFKHNTSLNGRYKKEFLISEIQRFVKEFNRIPIQKDFEHLKGYPSRKTFANSFGSFNKAIRQAGYTPVGKSVEENKIRYTKDFLFKIINDYIKKYNKVPTMKELNKEVGFEVKIYYKKVFKGWNNALKELGLPLNSVTQYDDEFLHSEFERFVKENGRIPILYEFNNSEYPSFWCYQNRFGSWNDAVRHYGYKAIYDDYNFENISTNLIKMCENILHKENRKIISVDDIEKCNYLPGYCCCAKHLKENGYTIRELLKKYNFEFCKNSVGMVYVFDDGERTVSSYEYYFSKLLRENSFIYNVNYFRDIKYKTFVKNYTHNMNCDYVVKLKDKTIYIEIAGYLRDYKNFYYENKIIISSKRKEEYRQKLKQKEQMFIDNHLEYYILFPSDLQEDFLLSIFSNKLNEKGRN